jgi:phage baseplate assembly protein W
MTKKIVGQGWTFPPGVNNRGGLNLTSERSEIEQSIIVILTTIPGERVMRPTFGCKLHELIFAPNNGQTAALASTYVEEALNMWEPRIRVLEVDAEPDPLRSGRLFINITYEVKVTNDRRSLVYPFYLIPDENEERVTINAQ